MREIVADEKQKIDMETWERRAIFQLFNSFAEPYHGVCLRVDCTATFRYAKEHRLSVFLSLVHRSLVAAHQVENFRTRIVDGEVWRYEQIHGGSAIGRSNGTIGFGHYPFYEDIQKFVAKASVEVERVKQRDDLERCPDPNVIRYSVLPWFDFTSISHARDLSGNDSAPRITFGKITEKDGRSTMPVSIHVNHALADGLHVAQFVDHFEKLLDAPEMIPVQAR
ncbi:CatA-like O-acetyltransferase [Edaphobacter flagellatus]|uniref:CatA-like O-acetyltransferase n=1 Tax=Edaphobacter flagellatus TaxID=1933044 RepID=UPI0021B1EF1D|nr:CatA-like O-acetyltransferase [Edaphobacter flagellatus]